jgi:hypothetical protein
MKMERKRGKQREEEEVGISNRGIDQERPAQDYVMDSVEGLEKNAQRDDLATGDRLAGKGKDIGRNLEPDVNVDEDDILTLTPEEQSGGVRRIDSRDAASDHSHH